MEDWRRCGLSADYVAAFLVGSGGADSDTEITLSTIANELLECTVKFSLPIDQVVSLHASWMGDVIVFRTVQWASAAQVRLLRSWVDRLGKEDAETLRLSHLEETARTRGHPSGLGLATLVTDHQAKLSMESDEGSVPGTGTAMYRVTLRAELPAAPFKVNCPSSPERRG